MPWWSEDPVSGQLANWLIWHLSSARKLSHNVNNQDLKHCVQWCRSRRILWYLDIEIGLLSVCKWPPPNVIYEKDQKMHNAKLYNNWAKICILYHTHYSFIICAQCLTMINDSLQKDSLELFDGLSHINSRELSLFTLWFMVWNHRSSSDVQIYHFTVGQAINGVMVSNDLISQTLKAYHTWNYELKLLVFFKDFSLLAFM